MDRPSRIIKLPARFAEGVRKQSNAPDFSNAPNTSNTSSTLNTSSPSSTSSIPSTISTLKAPPKTNQGAHRIIPYNMQYRFRSYVPSPLSTQLKGEESNTHNKRVRCSGQSSKVNLCGERNKTYKCKQKVFDDSDKLTDEQKDVKRDKNGKWHAYLDPGSWADAVDEAEGFENDREARSIMKEPPKVYLKCLGIYPEENRPS